MAEKGNKILANFLGVKGEEKESDNPLVLGKSLDPKQGKKRMHMIMQGMHTGIEKYYFWMLNYMSAKETYFGLGLDVQKIRDIYGATETSSYWGNIEARKGAQQDKVSQFLATIGKMTKDTFQMLRELRILDERIEYYIKGEEGDESAEIALKGTWIDMVEGGAKNPASVYGLAAQVGFVILPDLFFKVNPKNADDVDKAVDRLKGEGINRKVREVLARKLKQYMIWREKTRKELTTRKNFMLKYLRQHFNVIKMYISWVRPYLRNIRRLQMKGEDTDVNLVTAFESSKIELELLGIRKQCMISTPRGDTNVDTPFKFEKYFPCILVKFKFVTIPQMAYQQEYQRGAIHAGRTEIFIEPYVVTEKDIEEYKQEKDKEDMELISSLNEAMDALRDELTHYLEEAGELIKKEESKKEEKKENVLAPLASAFKGFGEMFGALGGPKKRRDVFVDEKGQAKSEAKQMAWTAYDVFKKANGIPTP